MKSRPTIEDVRRDAKAAVAAAGNVPGRMIPADTHGYPLHEVLPAPSATLRQCSECIAWKPKKNQATPIFGGCARAGTTTTHYGDSTYNHYTTDLQSCSAWEPK